MSKEKIPSDSDSPRKGVTVAKASEGSQMGLLRRIADDQRRIWTSPARLRISDTEWLVPLSGITAGPFRAGRAFRKHLSPKPTTISHYKKLSNTRVAALASGAPGEWDLF